MNRTWGCVSLRLVHETCLPQDQQETFLSPAPCGLATVTTWLKHSCKLLTNGDGMPLLFANPGKALGSPGQLLD